MIQSILPDQLTELMVECVVRRALYYWDMLETRGFYASLSISYIV
jgi:hypothetical protein